MGAFLDSILHTFEALGPWAYLVTALFALGESVIVVAYFLPGATVMAFLGFLCSMHVYNFWILSAAALAGHVAGEYLNYGIGARYGRRLFTPGHKHFRPELLARIEGRFDRGALRILLVGQFIGMLRPLVSLTAGVVYYPFRRFAAAMAAYSVLWALSHVGVGYVLGAAWRMAGWYLNATGLVLIVLFGAGFALHWLAQGVRGRARILARLRRIVLPRQAEGPR